MKPIIGISVACEHHEEDERTRGSLKLNWNYAQAVADAGGMPILIPPQADMAVIAGMIHGWLIPGGNDIDARHFGEENHPKVELQDPARYEAESALYRSLPSDLPVFGICYGCQFLNVVRGGSLHQHIPDISDTPHTGGILQSYALTADSQLTQIAATSCMTGKSYHHQAINRVGDGLSVVARSEDGLVEALEATDRPWMIGLQWHPERTLEDAATQRVFRHFVDAARSYMEKR